MAKYSDTVETQRISQNQLHIAGQPNTAGREGNADIGATNGASRVPAARLKAISMPVRTVLPEGRRTSEPVPIWLAVLEAAFCEAKCNGEYHAVRWRWDSGRAVYTNSGEEPEHIEPLGVRL